MLSKSIHNTHIFNGIFTTIVTSLSWNWMPMQWPAKRRTIVLLDALVALSVTECWSLESWGTVICFRAIPNAIQLSLSLAHEKHFCPQPCILPQRQQLFCHIGVVHWERRVGILTIKSENDHYNDFWKLDSRWQKTKNIRKHSCTVIPQLYKFQHFYRWMLVHLL